MATFTDNFNRADGAIGSNWTTLTGLNGLNIITNQVNATAGPAAAAHVALATETFAADHEAQCLIPVFNSFDRAGPGVRLSGNNGYVTRALSATVVVLDRMDAGVLTEIGAGVTYAVGDTIRIRAEGTTIGLYVNDVLLRSATDATYATGQPGLYYGRGDSGGTRLDDFYATDVGAAPAGATVSRRIVAVVGL